MGAHREALPAGLAAVVDRAVQIAGDRADASERTLVEPFTSMYLHEIDDDELGEHVEEFAEASLAHLRFGIRRNADEDLIAVVDDPEPTRATLLVVTEDAPFLVDTIRLALEDQGATVRVMIHPMLDVRRDASGVIADIGADGTREAWTQISIDRGPGFDGTRLRADVAAAIGAVHRVVGDNEPMRARAVALAEELLDAPPQGHTATEAEQVSRLLTWLTKQHFVFLSSASYALDGGRLRMIPGSQLGLPLGRGGADPGWAGDDDLLSIVRADDEVTVHRRARPVSIAVRRIDAAGAVVGEERFYGLFSAAAYRASVGTIPVIRERVASILQRARFDPNSHTGRALRTVLETFPRDELFEIGRDELADVAMEIVGLQERSLVRVLELRSPESGWQTLAAYLPRTRLTPDMPQRIADCVAAVTNASRVEFDTLVGSSPLARVTVEIRRSAPITTEQLDRLSDAVDLLSQRWEDHLHASLLAAHDETRTASLMQRVGRRLPVEYTSVTSPELAVTDLTMIDGLLDGGESMTTAIVDGATSDERRFRIYRRGSPLTLAELLPLLDQLGLHAVDERPFTLTVGEHDETVWLYDVGVRLDAAAVVTDAVLDEMRSTFAQLLAGEVESDGFNRLVLAAGRTAREVAVIRCLAKYLRQTSFPFSQPYIEATLVKHPGVVRVVVELFRARFDPRLAADDRTSRCAAYDAELHELLEAIPSLDEDRICRTLGELVHATLRTNAFRPGDVGGARRVIALKLDPARIADLPLPRPMFEIWVCSPRVEGVHLRGGRIARGGIRWSDRREDFRTEVLGLMKAQMVKNAVIVPVGSKGGFVVKRPPADADAMRAEVVECYRDFIAGLLDLTDNIVDGDVVAPPDTVRYDDDDPYLVVAADKGTATFSDIANAISESYEFWLGDAFASGGSAGYDHKVMGITARGAWESVRRHARVLGRNADTDPLTIVGIGDMSGDVFGNGLLRSPFVKLVAAFDHRHIFVDPEPDPALAFAERQRLFDLPRSSWADYDRSLISSGGGVFARTDKSIPISPEMRRRLGVDADEATPNELISAILSAPVDLLWNGGVGTYVKASTEAHADVGDRSNDAVRVNGAELRCKMVGEGGNLGFTQRGRVEFALAGGLINTDAIDNSAGVDCSDHEVNIKVLLNALVRRSELSIEDRDALLVSMTDEVGELVLDDNQAQTLALTMARKQATPMVNVHARYLHALEADGWLNRGLEFLPTDRQLAERQAAGQGLTTPEFSVLLAYTKNANSVELRASDIPDDPYLRPDLLRYFPRAMRERYASEIDQHQLRREIVTTQIVNQMVNLSGISFDHRASEQTGAGLVDITRAWIAARDITRLSELWSEIDQLDASVKLDVQLDLLLEARRMAERASLWILRHRRQPIDIGVVVGELAGPIEKLATRYVDAVSGQLGAITQSTWAGRLAAGVPDALAERSSVWPLMHTAFDVADVAARHHAEPFDVARTYWRLFEALDVLWLWEGIGALARSTRWETQARSALRDDLLAGLAELSDAVMVGGGDVETWLRLNERAVGRVTAMFSEVRRGDAVDITTLTVGLRQLRNLTLTTT